MGGALPLREVLSPLAPWPGDAEADINRTVALSAGHVPSSGTAGVGQRVSREVVRVAILLEPPRSQAWKERASPLTHTG